MFFEARSEGRSGMEAVATVALSRLDKNHRGAKTLCDVIYTPWQFSYLWDGVTHVVHPVEEDLYEEVYKMAEEIVSAASVGEFEYSQIGECASPPTHYHTYNIHPTWSRPVTGSMTLKCGRVGKHVFFIGK